MMRRGLSVLLLLLACGCGGSSTNVVKDTYKSSLERWPSGETSRILPSDGTVSIVTSKDIEVDALRMMENGYLLLGRSKFRGSDFDAKTAREAARELGASVVFVKGEYAKTVREAVPMETFSAAGRMDPVQSERFSHPGGDAMQGEYKVKYVHKQVDYFDLSVTFWAKTKPPVFGVIVERPGGETQMSAPADHDEPKGPEHGVVVRAVIIGSPAAKAGFLRDDVIVRFADTVITTPDQFFESVIAKKGKSVGVEVERASSPTPVKLEVTLANE